MGSRLGVVASVLLMAGCFGVTKGAAVEADAGGRADATAPTSGRGDASGGKPAAGVDGSRGKPDAGVDSATGKGDAGVDGTTSTPDAGVDASDGATDAAVDAVVASDAATDAFVCPTGQTACGGTCVDEQTDPNHCGACDTVCPVLCSSGACAVVTEVSVGFRSACAVVSGGAVECWGNNYAGALGLGTSTGPETCPDGNSCSPTPGVVTELSGATAVSAGWFGPCVLLPGGTVDCWGDNAGGQLGRGSSTGPDDCGDFACGLTPAPVPGLSGVSALSVNYELACALLSGGTVECWGANEWGQLGIGNAVGPAACAQGAACSPAPVVVSGLAGVTAIATGAISACALLPDTTVACWGNNSSGQLGVGDATGPETCASGSCSTMPVPVAGLTGVTAISVGWYTACAVLLDGTVACWGNNGFGQLGNGSAVGPDTCQGPGGACSTTPVMVTGLTGVTAVSVGESSACALLAGGTVECWGDNTFGGLGNGGVTSSPVPVPVTGIAGATSLSVGSGGSACVVLADGGVSCWGYNADAELGNGSGAGPDTCAGGPCATTPVAVAW